METYLLVNALVLRELGIPIRPESVSLVLDVSTHLRRIDAYDTGYWRRPDAERELHGPFVERDLELLAQDRSWERHELKPEIIAMCRTVREDPQLQTLLRAHSRP